MGRLVVSKALLMIVEDDPNVASFLETTLSKDYDTRVACDGKQALDILESATPDLVILDVRLPIVSGYDVYCNIRTNTRLEKTRVLVLTGYPDEPETALLREIGAEMIIEKPITPGKLRKSVRELLAAEHHVDQS